MLPASRPEELRQELQQFWAGEGVPENQIAQRMGIVRAVIRDALGTIVATGSAGPMQLPLIGDRTFWIFRHLAPASPASECWERLLIAVYEQLNEEYLAGDRSGPVGVAVPTTDEELMARRDEPVWPGSEMMFAGHARTGEQVRVRYFDGATI